MTTPREIAEALAHKTLEEICEMGCCDNDENEPCADKQSAHLAKVITQALTDQIERDAKIVEEYQKDPMLFLIKHESLVDAIRAQNPELLEGKSE